MIHRFVLATFAVAVVLASGFPATAQAQTTIYLQSSSMPTCRAITDALGIRLSPMGLSMNATGVQMSGCTIGTPFDTAMQPLGGGYETGQIAVVRWSAGLDATYCVYGGNRTVPGWDRGATACSGYGCAGMHTNQVVLAQAGIYLFSLTCTNDSGHASATVTAH